MSLFDKMKDAAAAAAQTAVPGGNIPPSAVITFAELPENLEQMKALPEASLDSPYKTAALAVSTFCVYAVDPDSAKPMLEFLRGPKGPLSNMEMQFIRDRLMDSKYVPFSYFEGAVPGNDYRPDEPYKINFFTDKYSFDNEGYVKLNVRSGGADSPRQVVLRRKGDQWFFCDQFILVGIRKPKSDDPWA